MARSLSWTPALATGIPEIDGQHRELFERASRFLGVLDRADRREPIEQALAYLTSYVRLHFAAEEAHMARLGYPDAESHAQEHRAYVRRLRGLESLFESEGDSVAVSLSVDSIVRTWLLDHVGRVDRLFGEYARALDTGTG